MVDLAGIKPAAPFDDQPARRLFVLEGSDRSLEITRVGEAVGSDRAAVREGKLGTVVLTHVAARGSTNELDLELDAARDEADLAR